MLIQAYQSTLTLTEQDYSAWHKNRTAFGVWYIEIEAEEISQYCQAIQTQFQSLLNPNYQRQWHITLFVNGFWVEHKHFADDFNRADLDLQINALNALNLKPFSLKLGHLHSFLSCPFIHIIDEQHHLASIRQALAQTQMEISPAHYTPHITLGFYQTEILGKDVLALMQKIPIQHLELSVKKLTFGTYQATALQGKLTPIYQFYLS